VSFFGNNEWDRVVNIEHLRTLWAARPSQHRSGVIGSREQARAEIRRRLREHYEAATSQAIPYRLAQLVEKIEQSESRSELGGGKYCSEQAALDGAERPEEDSGGDRRTPGEQQLED
jgi:hypothetical protein